MHKITLCQAERLAKKTRFGQSMTDDDLEHNRTMLERGEKILETKKLRPENQLSEDKNKEIQSGDSNPVKLKDQSRDLLSGISQDSQDSGDQDIGYRPQELHQSYPPRPLFFPVHKYFGY